MTQTSSFTIYNASAGAGKTYTLVKEYLATLLQSKQPHKYRNTLAITFTNKAVAEMKERVLEQLAECAAYTPDKEPTALLSDLADSLEMPLETIAKKSKDILLNIIHNYAAFDIVTIDTLTHRILRTFSKDLGLSGNFEVSLQVDEVFEKAVDALIDKAGTNKQITETLVNFALSKTDDDKSWDIAFDLNKIAKLLNNENDRQAVDRLKSKTIDDFKELRKTLDKRISETTSQIQQAAQQTIELLQSNLLEKEHFTRGSFYNHVVSLIENPSASKFTAVWQKDIEGYTYYKAKEKEEIKQTIDQLKPTLDQFFILTKSWCFELKKLLSFSKRIIPLSVLQLIHQEVEHIKEDENLLLISDFNKHIYTYLKEEPAPFIYERLGEKYTQYFIDEFQDTSILQWQNLVPLISHAIESSSEDKVPNSLMLVGDPKQAIYRWRGGHAEQFIELAQGKHSFSIGDPEITPLDKNWRSHKEIIAFNNKFFTHLSGHIESTTYSDIYKQDNNQKANFRDGGLVAIDFVEGKKIEDLEPQYLEKVLAIITDLQAEGIALQNVCILTRKKAHGFTIAQHLAENNIQIVSSESLLIHNAPLVQCIHAILGLLVRPDQPSLSNVVLTFLSKQLQVDDTHDFVSSHVQSTTNILFEILANDYQINFSKEQFFSLSLYEGIEYLIRSFNFSSYGDSYLFGYLNAVFDYDQKKDSGLQGFLGYWEQKKETLSISAPAQKNAVQLMSIHKSKGLEFPIVIFPYANTELYSNRDEYHWYDIPAEEYAGFDQLMVSHSQDLSSYSTQGEQLFENRQQQQQFDAVNILYVALTRAVERLYIVSRFRESKNKPSTFGDLLVDYIKSENLWKDQNQTYIWGDPTTPFHTNTKVIEDQEKIPFLSSAKENHSIQYITKARFLWDEKRQDAIAYGNLIHELLSKITYRSQIDIQLEEALQSGLFTTDAFDDITKTLKNVIMHKDLSELFRPENTVYNERPILSSSGETHIPDRIEITPSGQLTILDYKTGTPQEDHEFQLDRYTAILTEMGYEVYQRKLVYVNDEIQVLNV